MSEQNRRSNDIIKHILFALLSSCLTVIFTVPALRADIENIKKDIARLDKQGRNQIKDLKLDTEKRYDYLIGRIDKLGASVRISP